MKTRFYAQPQQWPQAEAAPVAEQPGAGANLMTPPAAAPPAAAPAAMTKFGEFEIPADRAEYVTNKGWKDTAALLDSYTNLEKLTGVPENERADRLLIAPKADAKPEEIQDFVTKANRLMAAEKPEDYGLSANVPEGVPPELFNAAEQAFHKAGVPKTMAPAIIEGMLQYEGEQVKAFQAKSNDEVVELQGELGAKFDDEMEIGRRARAVSGLEQTQIDAMERAIGTKSMLNMFRTFGKNLAEAGAPNTNSDAPGSGSGGNFRMSKEQAQAKINANFQDAAFMARYNSPSMQTRQSAIDAMTELHKIVSGDS